MTNGSPGSVVDGVEIGGLDLIALGVMDPDGSDKSDKSDDLPPDPKSLPYLNSQLYFTVSKSASCYFG